MNYNIIQTIPILCIHWCINVLHTYHINLLHHQSFLTSLGFPHTLDSPHHLQHGYNKNIKDKISVFVIRELWYDIYTLVVNLNY